MIMWILIDMCIFVASTQRQKEWRANWGKHPHSEGIKLLMIDFILSSVLVVAHRQKTKAMVIEGMTGIF